MCMPGERSELSSSAPSFTGMNGLWAGTLHKGVPHSAQKALLTSAPLSPLLRYTLGSPLVTETAEIGASPT
jgi:hypothetical protein